MEEEYHSEFYNKLDDQEQWIRLSDGCYRNCWNCYCPQKKRWYPIPEIKRNKVRFLDMNFIWVYPNPRQAIEFLGKKRVNKKVVHYHFMCGLDFTLITSEIAIALKKSRFGRFNNKGKWQSGLQLAWDRGIDEKESFLKCIEMLNKAGYKNKTMQVFMLCNGKVSYNECMQKLKVLNDFKIQICDCWYDNQKRGSVSPIYWTEVECELFGECCRAHNISVIQNQINPLKRIFNYK